ncbi:hypothetical protein BH11PLA2_BH11PLA2_04450 [soil metagenome]
MNMDRYITPLFLFAGFMNVGGVMLFSHALTSNALGEQYPEVMGKFGLVVVMLWGLAYWSVARTPAKVPALLLVFTVEKAVYVASWVHWMFHHGNMLDALWASDPQTAIFFVIYGPNDFVFGLVFAWFWWKRPR